MGIMPDRDPRIDPQRGDMVLGNGQVRRIMAREGNRVRCASGQSDYRMLIDNWRKWCRLNGAGRAIPHGRWSSRAREDPSLTEIRGAGRSTRFGARGDHLKPSRPEPPLKRLTPMELIKADTGLGDLDLADIYNAHHGTTVPGPLKDKHLPGLRAALAAVSNEKRRGVRGE